MASIHVVVVCSLTVIAMGLRITTEKEPVKTLCHNSPMDLHGNQAPYGTNCPQEDWIDAMVDEDGAPGKVIVSIGCNKGQDAIKWMQRWDSMNFYNMSKWMQDDRLQHLPRKVKFWCPVENDFKTIGNGNQLMEGAASPRPIGVCADLLKSNIDLVTSIAENLGYVGESAHGTFHIIHGAVTDQIGENKTVTIMDEPAGFERAHLKRPPTTEVEVMTVDSLTARLELPKVDILTIDTEGFDPLVLKGAMSTLASVRYLEFEVHRDLQQTPWETTRLREVMVDLDQKGFECYWAGNNGKLLSMNHCWDDRFEEGTWSNAACVKRNDAWAGVLERFARA